MTEDILALIKENVVQGRINKEDEGMEDGMEGQPAVTELVQQALDAKIDVHKIINDGLTSGMDIVGQKFVPVEGRIVGHDRLPRWLSRAYRRGVAI